MNRWIGDLQNVLRNGECGVVVTVAGVRGSAPRETGARMIVTVEETIGSIGGGQLEYQCTKIAVEQLQKKGAYSEARLKRRFPLGTNCGQCCGGVVDVMFERVESSACTWLEELARLHNERRPVVLVTPLGAETGRYLLTGDRCLQYDTDNACAEEVMTVARQMLGGTDTARVVDDFILEPIRDSDFNVAIFGAGHVGAATVDVLAKLDANIRWIDNRRNIFPAHLAENVMAVESAHPSEEVAALPAGTYYLVMTHSHPLDFEICDRVLRRGDFSYCGLIGSLSKRRRFERLMRKQAMPETLLDSLICPIGIAGIASKKPAEIAVAVVAELLRFRDAASAAIDNNAAGIENVRVL
jgi:xanthine dehydrogenase accessory factor